MAFIWTTISAGNLIKASEYEEIRDNIDAEADNLSVAHYGWGGVAPSAGDLIEALDFTELQDAIDYIDDENYCQTENADHDVTIEGTENGTYWGSNLTNEHGTYLSGVNNGRNYIYCGTNHSGFF